MGMYRVWGVLDMTPQLLASASHIFVNAATLVFSQTLVCCVSILATTTMVVLTSAAGAVAAAAQHCTT